MFFCINPLVLRIILILFTVFLRIRIIKIINLMFFSYLFIIVYTRGIIVLFCYLRSFIPNKLINKFNFITYIILTLIIWFFSENFKIEINNLTRRFFVLNNFYIYILFIVFVLCVYLFNLVYFLRLKKYPLRII